MARLLVVSFHCPACYYWIQRALAGVHDYVLCPHCGSRVSSWRVYADR